MKWNGRDRETESKIQQITPIIARYCVSRIYNIYLLHYSVFGSVPSLNFIGSFFVLRLKINKRNISYCRCTKCGIFRLLTDCYKKFAWNKFSTSIFLFWGYIELFRTTDGDIIWSFHCHDNVQQRLYMWHAMQNCSFYYIDFLALFDIL